MHRHSAEQGLHVPAAGQYDANRGIVRGSYARGSYVNISNITVKHSTGKAFSFSQPHSNFNFCTAIACGQDGFLLNGYTPNGEMASYCRVNEDLSKAAGGT